MSKKSLIILSGYNQRALISICRFASTEKITFYIIASNKNDSILNTSYKKNVIKIHCKKELDKYEIYNTIKRLNSQDQYLILPTSEFLNRFLLNNRTFFENKNIEIPLCDKKIYELISDKYSFGNLCLKNNINVPIEFTERAEIKLPCVIKPKKYFNTDKQIFKPELVFSEKKLEDIYCKYKSDEFYFQEYIEGDSYYLLYFFSKNGKYSVFSQENLMQQAGGKSIISAISSNIHSNEIAQNFADILLQINFFGLIMIEIKEYNNSFYMIEANPRFWGPSQLIIDSNMDLFHQFAYDYNLINNLPKKKYKEGCYYFWSGGLVEDTSKNDNVKFYNFNKNDFLKYYHFLINNDMYAKGDTIKIYMKESKKSNKIEVISRLHNLYNETSKHSNYQILPSSLQNILKPDKIKVKSRFEKERLNYMINNIKIEGKRILDIGANTGFFTFEFLEKNANCITVYEGNNKHVDFISSATELLNFENQISVINKYFSFKNELKNEKYNIILLLNVLHHVGDDYGNEKINIKEAKKQIIESINFLSEKTDILILQLGFCWQGNVDLLLFDNGTKEEMINFIKAGIKDYWNINKIGIPEKIDNKIVYKDLNKKNIIRNDSLGEFLNRPLFILHAK